MLSKLNGSIPGYSLVLVLVLVTVLSILSGAVMLIWKTQRLSRSGWVHGITRSAFHQSLTDSLLSEKPFSSKGFTYISNRTDLTEWAVTIKVRGLPWGFYYRLETSISDPLGSDHPVSFVHSSVSVPAQTVLIVDEARNGLILAENSLVTGHIAIREGVIQSRRLDWRSSDPSGKHLGIVYQLTKPLLDSLPNGTLIPNGFMHSRFSSSASAPDSISWIHLTETGQISPRQVTSPNRQISHSGNLTFSSGVYHARMIYLLADTVHIESGTTIVGNLWVQPERNLHTFVKIGKNVIIRGQMVVAGMVVGEEFTLYGRLVCRDIQTYRPPTLYSGYLVGVKIYPSPVADEPIPFPWFVNKGVYSAE